MFGSKAQWLTDGDNHRSCKLTAFKVGSTHFNNCGRDFVTAVFLRANDHIGGYAVAAPIFAGIESKFGLRFPKFRENMIWHTQLLLKHTSNTHSYYWLEAYHSDMKAKHEYMAFIENWQYAPSCCNWYGQSWRGRSSRGSPALSRRVGNAKGVHYFGNKHPYWGKQGCLLFQE